MPAPDASPPDLCVDRSNPDLTEPTGTPFAPANADIDRDATVAYHPPGPVQAPGPAVEGVPSEVVVLDFDECVRDLTESGLLDSAEVESFRAQIATREGARDAQVLARELVRSGRLTSYQAGAVLQGKTRGLLIGNYLVLDKLGAGGMGMVFKARHRRLKRVVALKLLPPSMARDDSAVLRFQREAKAAAKLNHPNVVAVLDADEFRGLHFLVMEYVEGRDFSRVVGSQGPLPLAQAIDGIVQAAHGLKAAAEAGVVHRDIKPSNLLLEPGGTVKILDMGLARLDGGKGLIGAGQAEADADAALTQSNLLMGTIDYMSPEQAFNPRNADHRSDIYSLGCTLHFLLTGRPPYSGETVVARLIAHREALIPVLSAMRPEVPAAVDDLLHRMLAKSPADRFSSLDELINALEACRGFPAEPAPGPDHQSQVPAASDPRKHLFWMIAAGGVGVLALAVLAVVLSLRDQPIAVPTAGVPAAPAVAPAVVQEPVRPPRVVPEAPKAEAKAAVAARPVGPPVPVPPHAPFGVLGALKGHERRVNSVAVSDDGQRALSGGQDGTVRAWDLATGTALRSMTHDGPVAAVAISPDGRLGLSGSLDKTARLWDLEPDHEGAVRLDGHTAAVFAVALAPGGRLALSGSADRTVRTWDVTTGKAVGKALLHDSPVVALATAAGDRVLSGCEDGTLTVWNLSSRQMVRRLWAPGPILCLALAADGHRALSGHADGLLVAWDVEHGLEAGRMVAHGDFIRCAGYLPDGRRALAGSQEGILLLWDVEDRRVLYRFPQAAGSTSPSGQLGLAVLSDGLHALTADSDATVRPWTLPASLADRATSGTPEPASAN